MSALVERRPGSGVRRRPAGRQIARSSADSACAAPAGPATLEEVIAGAWGGLAQHRPVDCVVCGAAMTPRYGASGHAPVSGRCEDCGASLG